MLLNEFSETYYQHMTEQQLMLFNRFMQLRDNEGWPHRFKLMRNVAKTRKYTRTVYPPGWRFI